MADVLLTHSNHLFSDPKQVRKMQPYAPLQTLLAAACLREAGCSVALFDPALFDPALFGSASEGPREGFERALTEHRPRVVAVVEDNFNFLTKMCLTANRRLAFDFIEAADVPVLVNGSDATDHPGAYLAAGATAVLRGEVETSLVEAVDALLWGGDLSEVAGLHLGQGPTAARARIVDLDGLPDPAWDLAPLDRYREAWRERHGRFSMHLVSSRGCPFRCNWCAKPIYGAAFETLSPRRVAEQTARLKFEFGAEHVWFADDIFALRADWTWEFAREIERLDARLPFKMQSRCGLMTRDVAEDLARAGCEEVWMGAESGSQQVLDAMDKDMAIEQIAAARENLRRHGIRAGYFLQFGYPGETWREIEQTVEMVRSTEPDDVGVSVSYPLPGTTFYDRVAEQLNGTRNWRHSDDLAMMFRGAYSTEFYRVLRDAVHLEVETINGRANGDAGKLPELWRRVRALERTSAATAPTRI